MESDLFQVVSRLVAIVGRIVLLARLRQQPFMIALVDSLLNLVFHLLVAIENALQDGAK